MKPLFCNQLSLLQHEQILISWGFLWTRLTVLGKEKIYVVNMESVATQHWKFLEMVQWRKIMMVQEKLVSQ